MFKICGSCKLEKTITSFSIKTASKDGRKSTCKICDSIYFKSYYVDRATEISEKVNIYNKNNRAKRNKYLAKKKATDIQFRIAANLRHRLWAALKKSRKKGSAIKDLGCSIQDLKYYLESRFKPGMSWDNYGQWHIDHIKPLSSFDLTNREQLKEACNYKNLQPLWAKDNLRKSNKLDYNYTDVKSTQS